MPHGGHFDITLMCSNIVNSCFLCSSWMLSPTCHRNNAISRICLIDAGSTTAVAGHWCHKSTGLDGCPSISQSPGTSLSLCTSSLGEKLLHCSDNTADVYGWCTAWWSLELQSCLGRHLVGMPSHTATSQQWDNILCIVGTSGILQIPFAPHETLDTTVATLPQAFIMDCYIHIRHSNTLCCRIWHTALWWDGQHLALFFEPDNRWQHCCICVLLPGATWGLLEPLSLSRQYSQELIVCSSTSSNCFWYHEIDFHSRPSADSCSFYKWQWVRRGGCYPSTNAVWI